jgi:hypothetical protein
MAATRLHERCRFNDSLIRRWRRILELIGSPLPSIVAACSRGWAGCGRFGRPQRQPCRVCRSDRGRRGDAARCVGDVPAQERRPCAAVVCGPSPVARTRQSQRRCGRREAPTVRRSGTRSCHTDGDRSRGRSSCRPTAQSGRRNASRFEREHWAAAVEWRSWRIGQWPGRTTADRVGNHCRSRPRQGMT